MAQCTLGLVSNTNFKEELDGQKAITQRREDPYRLNTMVIDINEKREVTVISRDHGMETIEAGAVILAMGCRERPRGALNIPGYRPAGIYSGRNRAAPDEH